MALSIIYVQIPLPVFISEANNEAIKCLSLGEKMVNSESQKRFLIRRQQHNCAGWNVRFLSLCLHFSLGVSPLWNVNNAPVRYWSHYRRNNRHLSAESMLKWRRKKCIFSALRFCMADIVQSWFVACVSSAESAACLKGKKKQTAFVPIPIPRVTLSL